MMAEKCVHLLKQQNCEVILLQITSVSLSCHDKPAIDSPFSTAQIMTLGTYSLWDIYF